MKCPYCKSTNLRTFASVIAIPQTGEIVEDSTQFNKSDVTFCSDCNFEATLEIFEQT